MNTSELQRIKQRYNIVGNSDGLNRALDIALQVAPTDLSVLIIGESGAGKEIIPRVIHDNSPRRREKYFAINCGSIPEGTIDSELFGHEKGSFTGAIGESEGYFGTANKGTIFLDEVAELPLATQARLLRVGEDIVLLFRLFAMQMAEKYQIPKITLTDEAKKLLMQYKWPGNIRQLKNITEQMSILSKQREIDANTLLQFIPHDEESTQLATISKPGEHSYETEREILYKILYELRGNVNDLKRDMNLLKKQINDNNMIANVPSFQGNAIVPAQSSSLIRNESAHPYGIINTPPQEVQPDTYDAVAEEINKPECLNLNDLGRQMVVKALERNGGNRKKAAQELGISDRTLYRRIKQYGLD